MRGHASTCVLVLTALITIPAPSAKAASLAEPPDFSGNGGTPTNFALGFGSNTLSGNISGPDRDIVHVSIPTGGALSAVTVQSYVSSDFTAFAAVQSGSTWTGDPNLGGPMLGWAHFGAASGDILDDMGFSQGDF